jgi:hypothetical protein
MTADEIRSLAPKNTLELSMFDMLREIAYQLALFNEAILPTIREERERTLKQRAEWARDEEGRKKK